MSASKSVSILGVTGTIGQNSVDVILSNPGRFNVAAVSAQDNVEDLAACAKKLGAAYAVIGNEAKYAELQAALAGTDIEASAGEAALIEAAQRPCDVLIAAIVGAAGLKPSMAALQQGTTVALANKECLVAAGDVFMQTAKQHNATIIPVDSEHNAIFQLLADKPAAHLNAVTITASGGPFRTFTLEQMRSVTPEQAVKHPNWKMGAKISVDSATMMNKGLELIEAHVLFGFAPEILHVLVHPESIVHGLLQHKDGSVLAQLSEPDMRVPIAVALSWPQRMACNAKPLNLAALHSLHFEEPDEARFPALQIARETIQSGGSAPTILNAANEIAVQAFLQGDTGFLDISAIVEDTLEALPARALDGLDAVWEADREARAYALSLIKKRHAA